MLFKILHGDASRISTDITPFHEGYCYVTHDGYMYVDMNIGTKESPNNQRIKLNAKEAEKLTNVSMITPQMFGAKADGVTDDTAAIQAAFDSLTDGGTIYFPAGKYIVQHADTVNGGDYVAILAEGKRGIKVVFNNGATIKHNLTTVGRYTMFRFLDCNNLEICGGVIEGERDEHPYVETGYGSKGLHIRNCDNVYIHDMEIWNIFGDSIGLSGTTKQCENILVENCTIHDCYRNGIGIGGVKHGIIRNCRIYNIRGNAPEAGIDIEAEYGYDNEDTLIEDCYIHDCVQATISFSSNGNGTKVRGCVLDGKTMSVATHTNVELENTRITDMLSVKGSYLLRNCIMKGFTSYGGAGYPNVDFKAYNTIFSGNPTDNTFLFYGIQSSASFYFKDCDISHLENSSRPLFNMTNAGNTSVTIEGGKINLWNNPNLDTPLSSGDFSSFCLNGCQILAKSQDMEKTLLSVSASTVQMIDNVIDMSEVTTYSPTYIAQFGNVVNTLNCHANVFVLTSNVQRVINLSAFGGTAYLTQNSASMASGFCSSSGGTVFEHDNTTSESTDVDTDLVDEVKGYVDDKIAEIKASGIQQTPLFANSIEECTDTTKVYVLPDGYVYGYVSVTYAGGIPQFTNVLPLAVDSSGNPYGDELGYTTGVQLKSNGEEASNSAYTSTGFIKCKPGDVIRIQGFTRHAGGGNSIVPYKTNFTKYGNLIYPAASDFDENGIYTFTTTLVEDGYIRICVRTIASNAIVTINEEIKYSEPSTVYEWKNLGILAFVPAERFVELENEVAALKEMIS